MQKVTTVNANCENCRLFNNALKAAIWLEKGLCNNAKHRRSLISKLHGAKKSEVMKRIREWASKTYPDETAESEDATEQEQELAPYWAAGDTQYLSIAARMVAKSLCVEVSKLSDKNFRQALRETEDSNLRLEAHLAWLAVRVRTKQWPGACGRRWMPGSR